jgi:hypothetical protein
VGLLASILTYLRGSCDDACRKYSLLHGAENDVGVVVVVVVVVVVCVTCLRRRSINYPYALIDIASLGEKR